jgi:hypothetical protein
LQNACLANPPQVNQPLGGLLNRKVVMKKYTYIVEIEAPDDIDWSPKGWEASLNVAYESSGKFKVTAQHGVQSGKCPTCSNGIVYDAEFDKWFNCSDCAGTVIRR